MVSLTSRPIIRENKLIELILQLQPICALPIYFSVLTGNHLLPISLLIAAIPIGIRFGLYHHFFQRTPFDLPILIFIFGMVIGSIIAPDKQVALGALSSSFASISVYYGITNSTQLKTKYWLWLGIIICLITIVMSAWFFSQGDSRRLVFNQWIFGLFGWLPKTSGPVLQWNSLAALLSVVIPPLFGIAFFQNSKTIRIGALVSGLLFLGLLFLTASGEGWIGTAIGLTFMLFCWRKWTLGFIVPIFGILATLASIFYNKIHWLSIVFSVGHLTDRFDIWRNTLNLFAFKLYYPFTGLGFGSLNKLYISEFARNVNHTHNSYLQVYADTGIIGVLSLIIAVVIFIRMAKSIFSTSKQNTCYGAGIGLIGGIISGAIFAFFDVTTMVPVTISAQFIYMSVPLLWIIVAMFVGAYDYCRKPL